MFKVIRDFVPIQQFLVMCDESCGQYFSSPFDPAAPEDAQQAAFVAFVIQQGWKIRFDRQLCPLHAAKAKAAEERAALLALPTLSEFKN